jgi:hypothetical protein
MDSTTFRFIMTARVVKISIVKLMLRVFKSTQFKTWKPLNLQAKCVFHLQVDRKWGEGFLSLAGLSRGAKKLVSLVSSMRLVRHCGLKTKRIFLDSIYP